MPNEKQEIISVADLATALGMDPGSSKEAVLSGLAARPAGLLPRRMRLKPSSRSYKSHEEYEKLRRQPVRVRVTAGQPICENGVVYYPVERKEGRTTKPADVFVTDRARLAKIRWAVEEVPIETPTTAELEAKKAAEKRAA